MIEWYLKVVRDNYANFSGRARRAEYWYYILATLIINLVLTIADFAMGSDIRILSSIYGLVVFLPGLAVSVRRLHDVNKSGWFVLIAFIPIIGFIWLLILLATEGNYGPNQYGADPKNNGFDIDEIGTKEY